MATAPSTTNSLSPDTEAAKKPLTDQVNAVALVLGACHGLVNYELKPIDPKKPAAWFTTFNPLLDTAKSHAQYFIDTLQPNISSQVPQAIINYNETFVPASKDIVDFLTPLGSATLTADQITTVTGLVNAQLIVLNAQQATIKLLHTDLKNFNDDLIADHKALFDGADGIQKQIGVDQEAASEIQGKINGIKGKIQADSQAAMMSEIGLGVSLFITIVGIALIFVPGLQGLGIAVTAIGVLGIGGSIAATVVFSEKVQGDIKDLYKQQGLYTAEENQVMTLQGISASVLALKAQNELAQDAMSAILTTWSDLETKINSVITDLGKGEHQANALLAKLDIQSAQLAWTDLVTFATGMQKSWQSVTVNKIEQPKPTS